MTEIAVAIRDHDLGTFEGEDVIRVGIEIPNAGGGLRDALDFEPVVLHRGDEGYLVLHWKVKKVRFDPVKGAENVLTRVVIMDVDEAALVDDSLVAAHLAEQRERIAKAREEAAGITRLNLTDAGDGPSEDYIDELLHGHDVGAHADEMDEDCPKCAAEIAAEKDGD